ncbi:MAG: IS66 family insertion sequence element accessory protein TnpB, partial [Candidatus Dormibacteraceae bacterium]
MIGLPPSVRIYLATQPADMRRSFDGLAALTREFLGEDPLSGNLFCFRNRTGDRVKVLYWDRSGLCLWCKRLEKGVFSFPKVEGT